jgi:Dihydroorotate dehydrogenase
MKQRKYILSNTKVKIGKISFENPIWVASGTFGYGTEIPELVEVEKLGAIETKANTQNPREGNPPPRREETSPGMNNSMGLAKIGVDKYISEMIPIL